MSKIFLVMAGGALGTLARFGISTWMLRSYPGFPYGTLTVNVAGSFLIGLLWGMLETSDISINSKSFIFIGVLGGFTTFSSFALETLNLLRVGEIKMALVNIAANNILGLLFVFIGFISVRSLMTTFR